MHCINVVISSLLDIGWIPVIDIDIVISGMRYLAISLRLSISHFRDDRPALFQSIEYIWFSFIASSRLLYLLPPLFDIDTLRSRSYAFMPYGQPW